MWVKLAPRVREAMLDFQSIVSTRNDLGTLASMHNKFVRLALVRLRLSIQEFLGELPAETETVFANLTKADPAAPARLFLPVRPSILSKGEKVRIMMVATGEAQVSAVLLHTRPFGGGAWKQTPARLMGRRTYQATLGPFDTAAPLVESTFRLPWARPAWFRRPRAGRSRTRSRSFDSTQVQEDCRSS